MLAIIYTLLLGLLCACFVEVGIHTFLPESKKEIDESLFTSDSPEIREKRQRLQSEQRSQSEKQAFIHYVLSLAGSTVLAVISLVFQKSLGVLAEGILLGAVFTLGCGTVFGIAGGGRLARFSVATVSLVVTLALGWDVFLRHA